MSFFAGGDTAFVTTGSGVTTSGFSTPTSTSTQPQIIDGGYSTTTETDDSGVVNWTRTPEAQALQGRWVLLGPSNEVLDSGESPSELLARHPGEAAPTIVFVESSTKQYAV